MFIGLCIPAHSVLFVCLLVEYNPSHSVLFVFSLVEMVNNILFFKYVYRHNFSHSVLFVCILAGCDLKHYDLFVC